MAQIPSAPIAAASLVGGYLVARETKKRPLGGLVLAVGGLLAGTLWRRRAGTAGPRARTPGGRGAFGGSHPLAKKIGAWPAVLTAAATSAAASWLVADRRR